MNATILSNQSIVFFPSLKAAEEMAEINGGAIEGFVAAPAIGRSGRYVVKVVDTADGAFIGYL